MAHTEASQTGDVLAIIQPYVPIYRVALFDAISRGLSAHNIRLEVWHSKPSGRAAARNNSTDGIWSVQVPQTRISVAGHNLTYRRVMRPSANVAGVVAGLASTNLETYLLAARAKPPLMLWGHGRNYTGRSFRLDSWLERKLCDRASHIFTYTASGATHLGNAGVSSSKITVVRNSTDTSALRRARAAATGLEPDIRAAWGVEGDGPLCLFVGAYDESKRLPFMFEAIDALAAAVPGVKLLIAGDGPLKAYVQSEARQREHVSEIGRLSTQDLGRLSTITDILLMPGRVGLVAVDSLALGVPIATTKYAHHAPEASYLDATTSVWSENSVDDYAKAIADLLRDPESLAAMKRAAYEAGSEFDVERSASLFVSGILKGLGNESR